MIKYAKIEGYKNLGELGILSHLYSLIQVNKETPMIILIHAYEGNQQVFKGYVFNKTSTFKGVPLEAAEAAEIESIIGKFEQVEFLEFIKETLFEKEYSSFTEVKDEEKNQCKN